MWTLLFPVEEGSIHRCRGCDLLASGPTLDGPALAALYGAGFYEKGARRFRLSLAERIMRGFREARARRIHSLLKGPSRILDVGCGRGFTLAALQAKGHEVHGTQLSSEAVAFAQEVLHLRHIESRDLLEIGYPEASFDMVTLYHVLEHVGDPVQVVREISRILRPGGLLIVEVPHAEGLGALVSGRYWLGWDVPYHRFHFTQATLGGLVREAGLEVEGWSFPTLEYAPTLLTQSLLNAITGTQNRLFRALSFTGGEASTIKRRLELTLHGILALILAIPCTLLTLLGTLFRRGEVISVLGRKGPSKAS